MSQDQITNWVQIAAAIGVIAGLFLVGYELRQTHLYAQAEITNKDFDSLIETRRALIGEESAIAWSKACNVEDLSLHDRVLLDLVFELLLIEIIRSRTLEQVAGRDLSAWKIMAGVNFGRMFSIEQGAIWFHAHKNNMDPAIYAYGNQMLQGGPLSCTATTAFDPTITIDRFRDEEEWSLRSNTEINK